MLALLVTIRIKPGHREAFLDALLGDARGSVQDEPGCLRFDVLLDDSDPNRIFLYEVYRDEQALEAHRQAPHYLQWRETVKDWFDGEPSRHVCTTFFPSDGDWAAVKPL